MRTVTNTHRRYDEKKILYLVTEDWYFCTHRLDLARAARDVGYRVVVATRVRDHAEIIRREGLKLIPIRLRRRSRDPMAELRAFLELVRIYRSERPDIVHHVGMKPIVYGSLASLFVAEMGVINAVAGMGHVFSSKKRTDRILGLVLRMAFRGLMNRSQVRVIVQNPEDLAVFVRQRLVDASRAVLIRGSGVDPRRFVPAPETDGQPVVMLASRMLWSKGVGEFVEAAKRIRHARPEIRFVLVGDTDEDNPAAVPRDKLAAWRDSGAVEWWGRRQEMEKVLMDAHVVCLPTIYGEGVPKILIEAAACGRPIVATDVPGCREIVRNNETGFLVPPEDIDALVNALERLLDDAGLRRRMGLRAREVVENEFSIGKVVDETLSVYRDLA
jgi:glycosyltransferase involved in cell wall biosynthesis